MSFPRYSKYKDSGVEWLGQVPGHWDIDRLKRSTISAKNGIWGDEPQEDENDIPCVRVADFDRQALRVELTEPTIRNVVEKERVGRVLSRGDLLLEKSGGGEGQPVGCVVLYDDPRPAVCSNFVARVQTAPGMNSSFWRYVHAAAYAVRLNTRSIKQTSGIQNLDASQYLDERAGFPPLPEQIQIAAFLDRETAKIDGLVAEQRRLMVLLKEKRQAVISHAITKGLNPHAPMKPSGIEWFGEVPQNWSLGFKLKTLAINRPAAFTNGPFGSDLLTSELQEEGVPVIYIRDLKVGGYCRTSSSNVTAEKAKELDKFRVDSGDILIAKVGDPPGFCCTYPSDEPPGIICQDVIRMKPNTELIDSDYLCFLLNSRPGMESIDSVCIQLTRKRFSLADFHSLRLPIPPKEEQFQIAAFLREQAAKFDTLTAEAQRAIDLLQERRTALISAAVTGQIDVRQLAEMEAS